MNINDIKIMLLKGDKGDKGDGSYDDTELRELIAETFAEVQGEIAQLEQNYLNYMYPVGSIYITLNETSPAVLFGGTWEQIKDRFLLSKGDTYTTLEETGGEAAHTLTGSEMPKHSHSIYTAQRNTLTGTFDLPTGNYDWLGDSTGFAGDNQPHNNMPPYLVVNVWKRTA